MTDPVFTKGDNSKVTTDECEIVDLAIECEKTLVKTEKPLSIARKKNAIKKKNARLSNIEYVQHIVMNTLHLCAKKDIIVMKNKDGMGNGMKNNAPNITAMDQTSTSAMNRPSTGVMDQPSTSAMNQPSTGVMDQPSTSAMGQPSTSDVGQSMWKPGDNCRAIYSADGIMYEAIITSMYLDKGTCHVTYIGYCNTEEVSLETLQPSSGEAARKAQMAVAKQDSQAQTGVDMECSDGAKSPKDDNMDWQQPYTQARGSDSINGRMRMRHMGMPPMVVPPPPPPHLIGTHPENDGEALSAMLMSWYISGFHTGYYQGLKQGKNSIPNGGHFGGNSSRRK